MTSTPSTTEITHEQVLSCPMDPDRNDAGADSVRAYLGRLLADVWKEGEGFSGKRPFGNSGWEYEVYGALVEAELVEGEVDEDGYLETVDSDKAHQLVADAIGSLFTPAGQAGPAAGA